MLGCISRQNELNGNRHSQAKAKQLIGAVEAVEARSQFTNAGVLFVEYKEARFLVYGLNSAV
jgi:hypothetical protein